MKYTIMTLVAVTVVVITLHSVKGNIEVTGQQAMNNRYEVIDSIN